MQINLENIEKTCPESDIFNHLLDFDGKHIVELGCGGADLTRLIATGGKDRTISAYEVDEIAHAQNLKVTDLPNVTFGLSGAQDIPLDDNSADLVLMFKSLHHVPIDLMADSLQEIKRVLKSGGLAYISEPIFTGEFNEILRLFHDEQVVREAAFAALSEAVTSGLFELQDEVFFRSPLAFVDFAEFESRTINSTHTDHSLADDLHAEVKRSFNAHCGPDGAHFMMPIRVDLLRA